LQGLKYSEFQVAGKRGGQDYERFTTSGVNAKQIVQVQKEQKMNIKHTFEGQNKKENKMNINKERKQKSAIHASIAKILLVTVVGGLLLSACGASQPETYTIGVINLAPTLGPILDGFKDGLTELGYTEGENVTYIYEGVAESIDKLDSIAQGLVAADVDLILAITTPASQAAQRATADTDIPVLFVPVTDPVGAGLVDSLQKPGGNITGVTFGVQEARRLEWLTRIVPTIEQIYVPYNPEDRSAVLALETASAAATTLGVELITREARNQEEITAAIENVPEEADAIFLLPDSLLAGHATEFVELQLPFSVATVTLVENAGVLTSYGMVQTSTGEQAARLANQVLQGIKPADLPVETSEAYLAINLKAAEAIGLDISDEILRQAEIVVR
jgi:putative ABC transport system substrate-binding protein